MRAAWVAARTRNTLRHPVRLAAICGTVFTAALVLLVLAPRDARRASRQIEPLSTHWRDTISLLRTVDTATRKLAAAESTLSARRVLTSRPAYVPPSDTLPAAARAKRDSLTVASGELARLLERVENSPLPQSYRVLGESRPLSNDPRVRAMLDSLADVEREREDFGAGGGVDPIFVALTARATAIGRSIQAIAETRQSSIRDSLALLRPQVITAPVVLAVDTLGPLQRRDSLQTRYDSANATLDAARRANTVTERQTARGTGTGERRGASDRNSRGGGGPRSHDRIRERADGRDRPPSSVGSSGSGARDRCSRARGGATARDSPGTRASQSRSSPSTAARSHVRRVSFACVARECVGANTRDCHDHRGCSGGHRHDCCQHRCRVSERDAQHAPRRC